MTLIAKHLYVKTERTVTSTGQFEVEDERWIYLYVDRVETKHRVFPIGDVMDMSYRKLMKESAILYLHTKQGVFSYMTKSAPDAFITAFKQHFR